MLHSIQSLQHGCDQPYQSAIIMNDPQIDLSIIIVTWNAIQFTRECLKSLHSYKDDPKVEIIVVDNASTDGTQAMVEQDFSWVQLIRNCSNLGFAKANNIGMAASSGEYVCLVNSDVKVPEGCLATMEAYMKANPSVGMAGPQMECPNGLIGRSYMRFPTVWRCFCNALGLHRAFSSSKRLNGIMMTDFNNTQTAEVDVLNGWFVMVRRKALEQVGLLDEQFFMYGEDIDWSYRFERSGWKRVYLADACAFHYGGGSSRLAPTRFYIEMKRANSQFFSKHHGNLGFYGFMATTCLHEVIRVMGNVTVFIAKKAERPSAARKIERSLSCLQWLFRRGSLPGVST